MEDDKWDIGHDRVITTTNIKGFLWAGPLFLAIDRNVLHLGHQPLCQTGIVKSPVLPLGRLKHREVK